MDSYGWGIISLFGEEDARTIAMMYAKLYLEQEDLEFGVRAHSLIDAINQYEDERISEWIKREGEPSDKANKAGT